MANEKQIANCVCGGRGLLRQEELGFCVRCEFDPMKHTAPAYKHENKAISEWNARQATMDNLDRAAVCAHHKRVSYGKLQRLPQEKEKVPSVVQEQAVLQPGMCG